MTVSMCSAELRCPECALPIEPGIPACPECGERLFVEHVGAVPRDARAANVELSQGSQRPK